MLFDIRAPLHKFELGNKMEPVSSAYQKPRKYEPQKDRFTSFYFDTTATSHTNFVGEEEPLFATDSCPFN
jgi:hypothetical protein